MKRYGESSQHEKAKERIGEILRNQGWRVWVDCYAFECETAKGPRTYWPDVYAESPEYFPTSKEIMQLMIDNPDPIFSVVPHTPGNARDRKRPRTLGEQDRQERAELLWRYKARGVIIQNLRAALTMAGFKISGNLTDTTLNISKSLYSAKSGLSIYARGPTKTSGKSLASYRKEAVDYAIKALRHNGL
jgi:hypothetical protein